MGESVEVVGELPSFARHGDGDGVDAVDGHMCC